jgi:transcriptional regulator with XRE-family HTH domain
MPAQKLGVVLKRLREQKCMTQQELAKRAGVSQGYIAKLEPPSRPGRRKTVHQTNPSVSILRRLAKALGVPVTTLLE